MLRQEYGFEIKRMQRGLPPCDSSHSPTIEVRGLRNIPIWRGAVGQLPRGGDLRNFSLRPPAEYHFSKAGQTRATTRGSSTCLRFTFPSMAVLTPLRLI